MLLSQIIVFPPASGPFAVFCMKRKVKTSLDQCGRLMCDARQGRGLFPWQDFPLNERTDLGPLIRIIGFCVQKRLPLGSPERDKA